MAQQQPYTRESFSDEEFELLASFHFLGGDDRRALLHVAGIMARKLIAEDLRIAIATPPARPATTSNWTMPRRARARGAGGTRQ